MTTIEDHTLTDTIPADAKTMSRRRAFIPIAGLTTGAFIGTAAVALADPIIALINEQRVVFNAAAEYESNEASDLWADKIRLLDKALTETRPTSPEGAVELLKWLADEMDEFPVGDVHRKVMSNAIRALAQAR